MGANRVLIALRTYLVYFIVTNIGDAIGHLRKRNLRSFFLDLQSL